MISDRGLQIARIHPDDSGARPERGHRGPQRLHGRVPSPGNDYEGGGNMIYNGQGCTDSLMSMNHLFQNFEHLGYF